MTAEICGSHCPAHEHVCQRPARHQHASDVGSGHKGDVDPFCRDQLDKGAESCMWDPERNGRLLKRGELRNILRATVERQGGEWTPGRVKRLCLDLRLTHILRVTIRRELAALHAEGVLTLHHTPGRRYYTPAKESAQ